MGRARVSSSAIEAEDGAVATLVSFHAHPDDEAITTGGTLAKASAEGHRVVVVFATRGEHGECPPDLLLPGESLADRRTAEANAASAVLGVHRTVFLGYLDSGMAGEPTNEDENCFSRADVDEAASRLASIHEVEKADVLTVYDSNGGYGHPDHIQVHRVGLRAAEIAGVKRVLQATMNRDHLRRLIEAARGLDLGIDELPEPDSFDDFGLPENEITTAVDVTSYCVAKRAAMAAHASQIAETSVFTGLPEGAFEATWGTEWFAKIGGGTALSEESVFMT
jgi:LmbE family N-acetylglucosaminyl deacetylase